MKRISGVLAGLTLLAVVVCGSRAWAFLPPPLPAPSACPNCNIHYSDGYPGYHDHYLGTDLNTYLNVDATDYLYTWIYIDPENPPSEVALGFYGWNNGWMEIWWGVDSQSQDYIWGGTNWGAVYGGQLSSTGGWQRLTYALPPWYGADWIYMIDYQLYDGDAFWGETGYMVGSPNAPENVWVGDQAPGNVSYDGYHDHWNWVPYFRRSWLQAGGDSTHSGNNKTESLITPYNVSQLAKTGRTYTDTQIGPIIRAGASGNDTIFSGAGASLKSTNVFTGSYLAATPTTGGHNQVSAPAIDASLNYVYYVGQDACVHKYDATNIGTEYKGPGAGTAGGSATGCFDGSNGQAGWPQLLTRYSGNTNCTARGALTVGTSGSVNRVYAGVSCHDTPNADGNVTTIDQNGNQKVYNINCSNVTTHYASCGVMGAAGIWSRAGVVLDPITRRLFATAGDGTYNPNDTSIPSWGYSLIALNPDGTGHSSPYYSSYPLDSFTPATWGYDQDLGSSNTVVVPGNATYPNLLVVAGGDGMARVVNPASLGGQGHELSSTTVPSLVGVTCAAANCKPVSPIATWTDLSSTSWVFIREPNGVNAMYILYSGGVPYLVPAWAAPITTTNGKGGMFVANDLLYWGDSTGLHAVYPPTGAVVWSDSTNPSGTGQPTPVVVNGVLYFQGQMYTIGGAAPSTTAVPWVNLAEGRPTWQSSTYPSNPTYPSDLAVNGNTDGNISHNSTFHTDNTAATVLPNTTRGPAWTVDLGGMHTVKQIVIYNRTDCCQSRLAYFLVGGHNANGWYLAYQWLSTAEEGTKVIPIDLNISTDQILIQLIGSGGDNYLHLAEVQVIGN